jgi:hypothetical protein
MGDGCGALYLRGSQVQRAHERRVMLGEPPFGPLRVRRLLVCRTDRADPELPEHATEADLLSCLAASANHPSLQELVFSFDWLEQPAAVAALLDAVVDVALARRLRSVTLDNGDLTSAAVPALVRLLGSSALTELRVVNHGAGNQLLDDEPAAALLAGALRRNTTLTSLALRRVGLFDDYHAARAGGAGGASQPSHAMHREEPHSTFRVRGRGLP